MSEKFIGLFPGQGSQKIGMGKELFETEELAKNMFRQADEVLGFSLSEICFAGPTERLMSTAITQPAILTTSVICFELAKVKAGGSLPIAAAAGHSLGEYSALVAAGAISFMDAVLLVHKRGSYMQEAVPQGRGKMVAVLGKEIPLIEEACSKVTTGVAQIANVNAPGQIVVAGDASAVDEFVKILTEVSGPTKAIELTVSAPFHCPLMKPAEERLRKDLAKLKISKAAFPIYANYSAQPLTDPEKIRESLGLQVCGRVRWVESMENAIKDTQVTLAVEFGAGGVLSGLLKRINNTLKRHAVDGPTSLLIP